MEGCFQPPVRYRICSANVLGSMAAATSSSNVVSANMFSTGTRLAPAPLGRSFMRCFSWCEHQNHAWAEFSSPGLPPNLHYSDQGTPSPPAAAEGSPIPARVAGRGKLTICVCVSLDGLQRGKRPTHYDVPCACRQIKVNTFGTLPATGRESPVHAVPKFVCQLWLEWTCVA